MIIADENIEDYLVKLLRTKGYKVLSVKESHRGISDNQIISMVIESGAILITEDKDFGELVFAHAVKEVKVILLRYDNPAHQLIENKLLNIAGQFYESNEHVFITITKDKIRIRRL